MQTHIYITCFGVIYGCLWSFMGVEPARCISWLCISSSYLWLVLKSLDRYVYITYLHFNYAFLLIGLQMSLLFYNYVFWFILVYKTSLVFEATTYYRGIKFVTLFFFVTFIGMQKFKSRNFRFPGRFSKILSLLWTLGMSRKWNIFLAI